LRKGPFKLSNLLEVDARGKNSREGEELLMDPGMVIHRSSLKS
jgi:hypothetical protein